MAESKQEVKEIGRILTGHRPTGPRHIGHLVGTLETWARMQDTHECFFLIADLHVLTTDYENPHKLSIHVFEVLADWLAAGIDPERSKIILQSSIPEHTQLQVVFSMLVTIARLNRIPTYKEQQKELKLKPSLGLFAYPVLQAADILLYKAHYVPVGEDQLPHVELAREIARRFNQLYCDTFPEPKPILSPMARLPGIDNRTMHNSYGNTIALKDSPEETTHKVMKMYTDPTRIHSTDPGHIEGNPVFTYLDLFDPDREAVENLKEGYRSGRVGDVYLKQRLAEKLNEYLEPLRDRRTVWINKRDLLRDILSEGTAYARPIAKATYEEVHQHMGLINLR
jgi:tryptophanyl-tRNA synthetase